MNKFIPDMYFKSIFTIDYNKLKKKGIKVLLFDFDNTIIEKGNNKINNKTKCLINKLKKDFIIYVVSNSLNESKLSLVCGSIDIPYIKHARKPFKTGYNKLKFNSINNKQIAMVGDQVLTDVLGGNRMNYCSVLIDPISDNELFFTKINRGIEKLILFKNKKYIERGKYYD